MKTHSELRLLADGRRRLEAAHRSEIEARVRARYADRLAGASLVQRWRIALRIRVEVRQALAEVAPAEGLY